MIPKNKKELMADIQQSYSTLKSELALTTNKNAIEKAMEGHAKGTMMSVSNLVAYLVGWGELVLKWHERKWKGLSCDFPETGYKWNELGKLAQKFYQDYDQLEYDALVLKLEETVQKILNLIDSLDNTTLYEEPWYGKWTLGRMIQFNTSSPFRNARGRLRKYRKNQPV